MYINKLPPELDITPEALANIEKIPCATLLVRCYKASTFLGKALSINDINSREWRDRGLIIDAPDY